MSFRTALLAGINAVRGAVPRALDLRQHTVTVRTRTWSDGEIGVGTATNADTTLTTGDGVTCPRVVQVSSKDVIASNGILSDQDLKIGPITPGYVDASVVDPATTSTGREVFFKVTGPGLPSGGLWFKRIQDDAVRNFSFWIFLRSLGTQEP